MIFLYRKVKTYSFLCAKVNNKSITSKFFRDFFRVIFTVTVFLLYYYSQRLSSKLFSKLST